MADDSLRGLVSAWQNKLRLAWGSKKKEFQDDADEAMRFFNGPYDFLYSWRGMSSSTTTSGGFGSDEEIASPTFRMTVNKVAELVQLFGPALYHKNPIRKVNPRKPPLLPIQVLGDPADPNVQAAFQQMVQQVMQQRSSDGARGALLECYLNYTPAALDLKTESRWAIDEAIIKGRGVLWTDTYHPAGAQLTMVGSFFDTVDNLLIDPDAEKLSQARWIAQRCVAPYWDVEREYQLPPESLKSKATLESFGRQAEVSADADGDYQRKRGQTNDLIVYWKIWSKMGLGGRLLGVPENLRAPLEAFGDFCYLVLSEGCHYPLNLPPPYSDAIMDQEPMIAAAAQQAAAEKVQWPTPFWADDAWPCTMIDFHPIPRRIWPMSHIKPAMGELKFLNWAFSFLAGKVRTASRDFLAIMKSTSEELKERITTGPDYTVIEVDQLHGSIDNMVKFLQHPTFNPEIYKVIEGVTVNFERRTGLTELMYGSSSKQIRSAEEASAKQEFTSIRPDDMANKVEDAMGEAARKEAFGARWHVKPQDVVPVMGPIGAQWWGQLVTASDPAELLHQLEYRIEAGSTKKPNLARDSENMKTAMQTLFMPLWQLAMQSGNVGPVNALLTAWAKSIDLDVSQFLLPPPQAQPPGIAPPGQPPGPSAPQQRPPMPPLPQGPGNPQQAGSMQPTASLGR